jgi:hypothetical protein
MKKNPLQQFLTSGKSKGVPPKNLDKKELKMGEKVELEHTSNKMIARKIAFDHLSEFKNYYSALHKMEKSLEKNADAYSIAKKAPEFLHGLLGVKKYEDAAAKLPSELKKLHTKFRESGSPEAEETYRKAFKEKLEEKVKTRESVNKKTLEENRQERDNARKVYQKNTDPKQKAKGKEVMLDRTRRMVKPLKTRGEAKKYENISKAEKSVRNRLIAGGAIVGATPIAGYAGYKHFTRPDTPEYDTSDYSRLYSGK